MLQNKFDRRVQDGTHRGGRPKNAAFGGMGGSDRLKKGRKSKAPESADRENSKPRRRRTSRWSS